MNEAFAGTQAFKTEESSAVDAKLLWEDPVNGDMQALGRALRPAVQF